MNRYARKLTKVERLLAWVIFKLGYWQERLGEYEWQKHEARYQQEREQLRQVD